VSIGRLGQDVAVHVAAIPVMLCEDGYETRAWQICDIATHPEHRGRSFFRRALDALLQAIPAQSLVFCMPNMRSHPLLLKCGFKPVGKLDLWVSLSPLLSTGAADQSHTEPIDPVACSAARQGYRSAKTDRAYIQWRFLERPGVQYQYVKVDDSEHGPGMGVIRPFRFANQQVCVLMLMIGNVALQPRLLRSSIRCAATRGARAMLYLASSWSGSRIPFFFRIPDPLLPRSFPIVATGADGKPFDFCTSDWDVL
jgi:hypothetical protein